MKVERINENKVVITLSLEELESRDITIKDIEKNSNQAQKLYSDLIKESNLDEEFDIEYEDSQLFIEASSDNNNMFFLTITKITNIPDISSYNAAPQVLHRVGSRLYEFSSMDILMELCSILSKENPFLGNNTLYQYENRYFLLFSPTSIKNKKFVKTFVILSEYCSRYFSYDLYYHSIQEKGKIIIKNRAIQKLSKFILK